jgi:hypothetical protein
MFARNTGKQHCAIARRFFADSARSSWRMGVTYTLSTDGQSDVAVITGAFANAVSTVCMASLPRPPASSSSSLSEFALRGAPP